MKNLCARLSGLAILLASPGALAYEHVVTVMNEGFQPASGLALQLEGWQPVTAIFRGIDPDDDPVLGGKFRGSPWRHHPDGFTEIFWSAFMGPGPAYSHHIARYKRIQVGWSIDYCPSIVRHMYWMNDNWNRLYGNTVHVLTTGIRYSESLGPVVQVHHGSDDEAEVSLKGVRFAVVPDALALDNLSVNNLELFAMLEPLEGGEGTLGPGETHEFVIPASVEPGQALIVVYETGGMESGGSAESNVHIVQQRYEHDRLPCLRME